MIPRKKEDFNENWEADIAAFDAEREAEEKEYHEKNIIFDGTDNPKLTAEENEVFNMVLRGIPLSEIADQYGIEEDVIYGLVEVIRAKLSLPG